MFTEYPKAMNKSIEDVLVVKDAAEEKDARANGYVSGHEFYSKLSAAPEVKADEPKEPCAPVVVPAVPTKKNRKQ